MLRSSWSQRIAIKACESSSEVSITCGSVSVRVENITLRAKEAATSIHGSNSVFQIYEERS